MASRICIDCGLTTDAQGRLIVNTGGATWPFACSYTNGVPIVCGVDGVLRSGRPEKSHFSEVQYLNHGSGQVNSATFNSPPIGVKTYMDFPIVIGITNPSACLPMTVVVDFGINHSLITKTGAGDTDVVFGSELTVTGGIVAGPLDCHTQWQHSGSVTQIKFDAQGQTEKQIFTLAAAGSATFSLIGYVELTTFNGNTTMTNFITTLAVDRFHN